MGGPVSSEYAVEEEDFYLINEGGIVVDKKFILKENTNIEGEVDQNEITKNIFGETLDPEASDIMKIKCNPLHINLRRNSQSLFKNYGEDLYVILCDEKLDKIRKAVHEIIGDEIEVYYCRKTKDGKIYKEV
jgi:hypothetical protein